MAQDTVPLPSGLAAKEAPDGAATAPMTAPALGTQAPVSTSPAPAADPFPCALPGRGTAGAGTAASCKVGRQPEEGAERLHAAPSDEQLAPASSCVHAPLPLPASGQALAPVHIILPSPPHRRTPPSTAIPAPTQPSPTLPPAPHKPALPSLPLLANPPAAAAAAPPPPPPPPPPPLALPAPSRQPPPAPTHAPMQTSPPPLLPHHTRANSAQAGTGSPAPASLLASLLLSLSDDGADSHAWVGTGGRRCGAREGQALLLRSHGAGARQPKQHAKAAGGSAGKGVRGGMGPVALMPESSDALCMAHVVAHCNHADACTTPHAPSAHPPTAYLSPSLPRPPAAASALPPTSGAVSPLCSPFPSLQSARSTGDDGISHRPCAPRLLPYAVPQQRSLHASSPRSRLAATLDLHVRLPAHLPPSPASPTATAAAIAQRAAAIAAPPAPTPPYTGTGTPSPHARHRASTGSTACRHAVCGHATAAAAAAQPPGGMPRGGSAAGRPGGASCVAHSWLQLSQASSESCFEHRGTRQRSMGASSPACCLLPARWVAAHLVASAAASHHQPIIAAHCVTTSAAAPVLQASQPPSPPAQPASEQAVPWPPPPSPPPPPPPAPAPTAAAAQAAQATAPNPVWPSLPVAAAAVPQSRTQATLVSPLAASPSFPRAPAASPPSSAGGGDDDDDDNDDGDGNRDETAGHSPPSGQPSQQQQEQQQQLRRRRRRQRHLHGGGGMQGAPAPAPAPSQLVAGCTPLQQVHSGVHPCVSAAATVGAGPSGRARQDAGARASAAPAAQRGEGAGEGEAPSTAQGTWRTAQLAAAAAAMPDSRQSRPEAPQAALLGPSRGAAAAAAASCAPFVHAGQAMQRRMHRSGAAAAAAAASAAQLQPLELLGALAAEGGVLWASENKESAAEQSMQGLVSAPPTQPPVPSTHRARVRRRLHSSAPTPVAAVHPRPAVDPGGAWDAAVEPGGAWDAAVDPGGAWDAAVEPGGAWDATVEPGGAWDAAVDPGGAWDAAAEAGGHGPPMQASRARAGVCQAHALAGGPARTSRPAARPTAAPAPAADKHAAAGAAGHRSARPCTTPTGPRPAAGPMPLLSSLPPHQRVQARCSAGGGTRAAAPPDTSSSSGAGSQGPADPYEFPSSEEDSQQVDANDARWEFTSGAVRQQVCPNHALLPQQQPQQQRQQQQQHQYQLQVHARQRPTTCELGLLLPPPPLQQQQQQPGQCVPPQSANPLAGSGRPLGPMPLLCGGGRWDGNAIEVVCGGQRGVWLDDERKVVLPDRSRVSGTRFEIMGGRAECKQFKVSLKLAANPSMCLAQWMASKASSEANSRLQVQPWSAIMILRAQRQVLEQQQQQQHARSKRQSERAEESLKGTIEKGDGTGLQGVHGYPWDEQDRGCASEGGAQACASEGGAQACALQTCSPPTVPLPHHPAVSATPRPHPPGCSPRSCPSPLRSFPRPFPTHCIPPPPSPLASTPLLFSHPHSSPSSYPISIPPLPHSPPPHSATHATPQSSAFPSSLHALPVSPSPTAPFQAPTPTGPSPDAATPLPQGPPAAAVAGFPRIASPRAIAPRSTENRAAATPPRGAVAASASAFTALLGSLLPATPPPAATPGPPAATALAYFPAGAPTCPPSPLGPSCCQATAAAGTAGSPSSDSLQEIAVSPAAHIPPAAASASSGEGGRSNKRQRRSAADGSIQQQSQLGQRHLELQQQHHQDLQQQQQQQQMRQRQRMHPTSTFEYQIGIGDHSAASEVEAADAALLRFLQQQEALTPLLQLFQPRQRCESSGARQEGRHGCGGIGDKIGGATAAREAQARELLWCIKARAGMPVPCAPQHVRQPMPLPLQQPCRQQAVCASPQEGAAGLDGGGSEDRRASGSSSSEGQAPHRKSSSSDVGSVDRAACQESSEQQKQQRQLQAEDPDDFVPLQSTGQTLLSSRSQRQQRKKDRKEQKRCRKMQAREQKKLKRKRWWEAKHAHRQLKKRKSYHC